MALFSFRSKNPDESAAAPEARAPGFIARMRARLNRGDSWLTYDLANLLPGGQIDDAVLDVERLRDEPSGFKLTGMTLAVVYTQGPNQIAFCTQMVNECRRVQAAGENDD